MAKLPAAKVGYIKKKKLISFLSLARIYPYQSVMLFQIYTLFGFTGGLSYVWP